MSSSNPFLISVAAHQEQLVQLDAGTELHCVAGSLRVRFGYAGVVHTLSAGQSVRLPDAQWVSIAASAAARVSVQPNLERDDRSSLAEKNRQGLFGLWRSLAERVTVRREPRAT